jgi:hypothetical protein
MQFLSFADGKKTYAVVAVGVALGVVQGLDDSGLAHVHVPSAVNWVLMFLGLGAARVGIQAQSAKATAAVVQLVRDVLANITLPPPAVDDPNRDLTGATIKTVPLEVTPLPPLKAPSL